MSALMRFGAVCVASLAILPVLASTATGAPVADDVSIAFDTARVHLVVGDHFQLQTTIANTGTTATAPLIAHLNVASLTGDVYVDPEDWSSSRSQRVEPISGGQSVRLTWSLQAVNSGWFDIYVVTLPAGSASLGHGPLTVSPPVFADVSGRQTANPGGALPAVIGIPILTALAAVGSRVRLRRARSRPS